MYPRTPDSLSSQQSGGELRYLPERGRIGCQYPSSCSRQPVAKAQFLRVQPKHEGYLFPHSPHFWDGDSTLSADTENIGTRIALSPSWLMRQRFHIWMSKLSRPGMTLPISKKKLNCYWEGALVRITADFSSGSSETMEITKKWGNIFKFLKEKNFYQRSSCPAKLSFRNEDNI